MNSEKEHLNWSQINRLFQKLRAELPANETLESLGKALNMPSGDLKTNRIRIGDELSGTFSAVSEFLSLVGIAYLELDEGFNIMNGNPAAGKILGIVERPLTGRNFEAFLMPEYRELFIQKAGFLKRSGTPQPMRVDLKDEEGTIRNLFLYLEPTGENQATGRIGAKFLDFEEVLRQLFPRLAKNMDIFGPEVSGSGSLVFKLDNEGRFVNVNQTVENVLGYNASDLIGLKYIDFIHPSEKRAYSSEQRQLRKNENLSIRNYRIRHKSGSWMNFNCTSFLSTDENGEKSLVIISDEILKAMNSEEDLKRTKLYQDILFNHLEGMDVYLVDKDMKFLYSAGREKNKFNLTDEDFTGKTLDEVLTPRIRRVLKSIYESALVGETVKKEVGYSGQVFEIQASPVKNQNGEIMAVAVTSKNITREKADRSQLRKAKQEAEAADKAKSLFLASMSHEIRTPLNTIIGFSNQMTKTKLTEEQKKYIGLIQDSSDQLINVVNELLIIFKIGMGRVFIDEVPFSIKTLFGEIAEIFGPEARRKNLVLDFSISRKIPELVAGDPFRVKQVLMNIISNAIKYTDTGYVKVSCRMREDKIRKIILNFTVEDTGIGIPREELPLIFDEFRQSKNLEKRHREGTGLGLTITKKLVELQNGKIKVESTLNKGTTFTVRLPFRKSRERIVLKEPGSYNLRHRLLAGKRLLLVDDDEQNLMLGEMLFREWGMHFDTASSADDGFEYSRTNKYDVILLDIHMPRISGIDLIRMIRKDPGNPNRNTKILTVTANILQSEVKKYMAAGFNDYLFKPFREEELYRKLCFNLGISPEKIPEAEETIPEVAEPDEERDYSLTDLKAAARGDKDFINRTIQTFFSNTQNSIGIIENALPQKNWTVIGEAAHKMISAFRYFKCQRIVDNLVDIETMALHSNDFTSIPALVSETIPLIDKTMENINKEFKFQTI